MNGSGSPTVFFFNLTCPRVGVFVLKKPQKNGHASISSSFKIPEYLFSLCALNRNGRAGARKSKYTGSIIYQVALENPYL